MSLKGIFLLVLMDKRIWVQRDFYVIISNIHQQSMHAFILRSFQQKTHIIISTFYFYTLFFNTAFVACFFFFFFKNWRKKWTSWKRSAVCEYCVSFYLFVRRIMKCVFDHGFSNVFVNGDIQSQIISINWIVFCFLQRCTETWGILQSQPAAEGAKQNPAGCRQSLGGKVTSSKTHNISTACCSLVPAFFCCCE